VAGATIGHMRSTVAALRAMALPSDGVVNYSISRRAHSTRDLSAASDLLKPFDAGPEAALSRERPDQRRGERRRGMRPRPAFARRSR
jgi:hypothetical protein